MKRTSEIVKVTELVDKLLLGYAINVDDKSHIELGEDALWLFEKNKKGEYASGILNLSFAEVLTLLAGIDETEFVRLHLTQKLEELK